MSNRILILDDERNVRLRYLRIMTKQKSITGKRSSSTRITNPLNRTCGAFLKWTTSVPVRSPSTLETNEVDGTSF
jgi:hypothetical protein